MKAVVHGIQPGDLRLNEGDTGPVTQPPQIDGHIFGCIDPGDQRRHHAGIERCAAAVDQHHQAIGAQGWLHRPAFEQQCMAVAPAGQQQGASPGRTHAVVW